MLDEVSEALDAAKNLGTDEQDELTFLVRTAKDAILNWKAHQLRVVHQDKARLDVIDNLTEEDVFLTQDFAMKFMPIKFREAQTDFFGKKGLSWHITVVLRKTSSGQLESQSFVHILEGGQQDSPSVVPIMTHVLTCLKEQHPEINNAYYRQDCAGSYHSGTTILSSKIISERSGVFLKQLDFSDPQGSKGAADRKAAQIKCHIKAHINQGNSVTTAKDLESAILSQGGIKGVRVAVVNTTPNQYTAPKLPGISKLNNFTFSKEGLSSQRAYQIGPGKHTKWRSLEGRMLNTHISINVDNGRSETDWNYRSFQSSHIHVKML